eukprot:GFKZ01010503.1.p1 GENE.GFKZ01010503.1~~GFKZ01010503.1.p1  ORF type:complete len:237 (+),score=16.12 GFKZ01010503.1:142-852(+)
MVPPRPISIRRVRQILPTFCLFLFSAKLILAQSADHTVISAPLLNGSHQSFLQPKTPFRQNALVCPCTCSATDPKTSSPCAAAPIGCMEVRCNPREDGFSCCDGVTIPGGIRSTAEAEEELEFIDDNAGAAAAQDPVFAQAAVDILGVCIDDLAFIVDDALDDVGGATSRMLHADMTISDRQRITPAQRREAVRLFNLLVQRRNINLLTFARNRLRRALPPPRRLARPQNPGRRRS